MKTLVVVCVLLAGAVAVAQEAWIPLEDLSAEEQAQVLDGKAVDGANQAATSSWSAITGELVAYADFSWAVNEAGANLLAGLH